VLVSFYSSDERDRFGQFLIHAGSSLLSSGKGPGGPDEDQEASDECS